MQAETGTSLTGDAADGQPETRVLVTVAALVLLLDQGTKLWALNTLEGRDQVPVIGSFLSLNLIANPGAAFSFGTGMTWVLTIVGFVIVGILVRVSLRTTSRRWLVTFALLIGGALSNLVDRMIRPPGVGRGHVVDFLDYNGWFIGNVADIAIVLGGALIALWSVRGLGLDGRPATRQPSSESTPSTESTT